MLWGVPVLVFPGALKPTVGVTVGATDRAGCLLGRPRVDRVLGGLSSAVEAGTVPFRAGSGVAPLRFWRLRRRLVSLRLWTTASASAPMV